MLYQYIICYFYNTVKNINSSNNNFNLETTAYHIKEKFINSYICF